MSEPLPDERLAEIEARCKAALPPPWELRCHQSGSVSVGCTTAPYWLDICHVRGPVIAKPRPHDGGFSGDWYEMNAEANRKQRYANGDFCAEARQDVPDLLTEVKRLKDVCRETVRRAEACENEEEQLCELEAENDLLRERVNEATESEAKWKQMVLDARIARDAADAEVLRLRDEVAKLREFVEEIAGLNTWPELLTADGDKWYLIGDVLDDLIERARKLVKDESNDNQGMDSKPDGPA